MKKGKILKFLTSSIVISSMLIGGLSLLVFADEVQQQNEVQHQNVSVKPEKCTVKQMLEKGDSSGLTNILANIKEENKKLNIKFNERTNVLPPKEDTIPAEELRSTSERKGDTLSREGESIAELVEDHAYLENNNLPQLQEGERYFVVVIDSGTEKIVKNEYLTANSDGTFECSLEAPWYSSRVDLHFYKQNANEKGDFVARKENFIGRTKVLMAYESNHMRQDKKPLTPLDKNGATMPATLTLEEEGSAMITGSDDGFIRRGAKQAMVAVDDKPLPVDEQNSLTNLIARVTPNYYSIEGLNLENFMGYEQIGKIVLPDDKKNLMTEDQVVVPGNVFTPDGAVLDGGETHTLEKKVEVTDTEKANNSKITAGQFFNFYLPEEINEFTFQVYGKNISDNKEDILYQFKIKLAKN